MTVLYIFYIILWVGGELALSFFQGRIGKNILPWNINFVSIEPRYTAP